MSLFVNFKPARAEELNVTDDEWDDWMINSFGMSRKWSGPFKLKEWKEKQIGSVEILNYFVEVIELFGDPENFNLAKGKKHYRNAVSLFENHEMVVALEYSDLEEEQAAQIIAHEFESEVLKGTISITREGSKALLELKRKTAKGKASFDEWQRERVEKFEDRDWEIYKNFKKYTDELGMKKMPAYRKLAKKYDRTVRRIQDIVRAFEEK